MIVTPLSGPEIFKKKKGTADLVSMVSKTGRVIFSVFDKRVEPKVKVVPKAEPRSITIDPRITELVDPNNHNTSIGDVYANQKARTNIFYNQPNFPVGSIIVREKYAFLGRMPDTVIAMVKRDPGFSSATGDWEFFVFDGRDLGLRSRETVGSCSSCHVRAKDTDWTFRTYMNFLQ